MTSIIPQKKKKKKRIKKTCVNSLVAQLVWWYLITNFIVTKFATSNGIEFF